jgi:hypothetical protein
LSVAKESKPQGRGSKRADYLIGLYTLGRCTGSRRGDAIIIGCTTVSIIGAA